MRYPKFLKKNGTIGFVAPSFAASIEPYRSCFDNALKTFKQMGYSTQLGPNCYEGCGIGISNTPEKCGQEFTSMYADSKNDVLISCGGGELMCEILDFVDFDIVRKSDPKWFMGYSDNTNLVFPLATLCDTAAIYAPCASSFGMEPWHESLDDAFKLLTGEQLTVHSYDLWEKDAIKDDVNPLLPYNVTEPMILRAIPNGNQHFSGRLIGGCMDCLVNLIGTKYDGMAGFSERYKEEGIIWFLEACDLNVFSMRRAMWQMEHAGWFKYVKGFILGRPRHFGEEMMGLDHYHALTEHIRKYNVPIVLDADIGHLPPMMPLITGSYADVELKDGKLNIRMKLI